MYVAKEDLDTGKCQRATVQELEDSGLSSTQRKSLLDTKHTDSFVDGKSNTRWHVAYYRSGLPTNSMTT